MTDWEKPIKSPPAYAICKLSYINCAKYKFVVNWYISRFKTVLTKWMTNHFGRRSVEVSRNHQVELAPPHLRISFERTRLRLTLYLWVNHTIEIDPVRAINLFRSFTEPYCIIRVYHIHVHLHIHSNKHNLRNEGSGRVGTKYSNSYSITPFYNFSATFCSRNSRGRLATDASSWPIRQMTDCEGTRILGTLAAVLRAWTLRLECLSDSHLV